MSLVRPTLVVRILVLVTLLSGWSTDPMGLVEAVVGSTPPAPSMRWVVWYGDDARIHRQQVDAEQYRVLRHALQEAQTEDHQRLMDLATGYLRVDLQPTFTDLATRQETFLNNVFFLEPRLFSSSHPPYGQARAVATAMVTAGYLATEKTQKSDSPESVLQSVQTAIVEDLVTRFRTQVLDPESTVRALRTAANRSLSLVRQNLLQDCDRYDRAFRGFVLESTTTMETLDAKAGWQVDIAWRPETATFRSLCVGLRYTDPDVYLVQPALLELFQRAEKPLRDEAFPLFPSLAKHILGVKQYTDETTSSLGKFGLSDTWAHPPVAFVNYLNNVTPLIRHTRVIMDPRRLQPRLRELLRTTAEQLQANIMDTLKPVFDRFITSGLEDIDLGLAARSEGAWSTP